MNYLEKIIGEIEEHSVEGIKECFANGVNPVKGLFHIGGNPFSINPFLQGAKKILLSTRLYYTAMQVQPAGTSP